MKQGKNSNVRELVSNQRIMKLRMLAGPEGSPCILQWNGSGEDKTDGHLRILNVLSWNLHWYQRTWVWITENDAGYQVSEQTTAIKTRSYQLQRGKRLNKIGNVIIISDWLSCGCYLNNYKMQTLNIIEPKWMFWLYLEDGGGEVEGKGRLQEGGQEKSQSHIL